MSSKYYIVYTMAMVPTYYSGCYYNIRVDYYIIILTYKLQ